MMHTQFHDVIASQEQFEELRALCGNPSQRAADKVISHLDRHCREFIAKSPFLTLATADRDGRCDVSPRGDAPGFVQVLDEGRLFIPERPGNRRMDSIHNIMTNPYIGLIFFIPGLGETLRVNGRACISRDPELLERTAVNGRAPLFGIGVVVEECYMHCAKAMIRSGLWSPESWISREALPSPAQMLIDHAKLRNTNAEQVAKELNESYVNRLY